MQTTIEKSVKCTGVDPKGDERTITFHPAAPDSGIVFKREDLPGKPAVECRPEHARSYGRWTSLNKGCTRIEHIEHVLAAVSGLGIDNIIISLDSGFVPLVSKFSSQKFVQALLKAKNISQTVPRKFIRINTPLWISDYFIYDSQRYESILLALPAEDFLLTYLLDYPGGQLPTQSAHYNVSRGSFASEIAPARSFILSSEYPKAVKLLGKAARDLLIITKEPPDLYWENEPARHKLLDLLGDLSTLGRPVLGHFIGIRTGHKINIRMCHRIVGLE